MKFHILFKEKTGPAGGGNQFLKALKEDLERQGVYVSNAREADCILFNSYPFGAESLFFEVLKLKLRYPKKIILYRIDGPISIYREKDREIDQIISLFNTLFSDGTIYQSQWSKEQNKELFSIAAPYEAIIYNAPNPSFFNTTNKEKFTSDKKIKLVGSSWSTHKNKGFPLFQWLDEHLDFSRYEMTFIGNSPVTFRNITVLPPLPSEQLAQELKKHDIYIFASRIESCSNALIEALSCGLPALAPNFSSNPEIVGQGGELFENESDILVKLKLVSEDYFSYQNQIRIANLDQRAGEYQAFAHKIYTDTQKGDYTPKRVDLKCLLLFCKLELIIGKWKILNIVKNVRK